MQVIKYRTCECWGEQDDRIGNWKYAQFMDDHTSLFRWQIRSSTHVSALLLLQHSYNAADSRWQKDYWIRNSVVQPHSVF